MDPTEKRTAVITRIYGYRRVFQSNRRFIRIEMDADIERVTNWADAINFVKQQISTPGALTTLILIPGGKQ